MDLELREALALSDDRKAALAQLLPGSEDHDFYRCLHAQHAGAFEDAEEILRAWPERHGSTQRYQQLRLRQQLYQVTANPEQAADDIRDRFGVSHWHEAEVEETDPKRPTRLAAGAFDGDTLLQQAFEYDTNLSQVTDEGLLELVARPLDPARRRVLLSRLAHTPQPEIVGHVLDELATKGSGGFGSLAIHSQLTHDQLMQLAARRPELLGHAGWVAAVIQRMRPPATVDLELDRDARADYLARLWQLVGQLPPAINTLKVHVLWHLLDVMRRRSPGPVDATLVRAYLALPRSAGYLARTWIDRVRHEDVAQLGADLRATLGLPPPDNDEELVRDLISRDLAQAEQYAQWLDRAWLDAELATATLLAGGRDSDRATLTLGPARAAALRDRIELAWCVHNPTRFAATEPVVLEADVKNVPELVIKVFRIDPLAYFQHQRREINTDLDLDGLAASHEQTITIAEPPVRRVRRRIELAFCARPGTYVIDLIGNGMSSRVLVEKGRLRHLLRIGAAGHVVTILDEIGEPRPDARAWIGEREYTPDDNGVVVVPFSTAPARTPMMLVCGDIASVAHLDLVRETYQLAMNLVLERESLAVGRTARAIARVALTVAGKPASLALLERTTWDVTLTDRRGVSTTKSQPLVLSDDAAAVLEWPVPEDTAKVAIAIRGAVEVRSEQRRQDLEDQRVFAVGTIHASTAIEALYLARTSTGWVVSALGKSGEPRAQRPVTVTLVHRWARTQLNVELATDERGRVELGTLPGVEWIVVTLGGLTQRWYAGESGLGCALAAPVGRDVVVPVPPGRSAAEVARRSSLVELRGSAPVRHASYEPELLEGAIVLRGLPAGDYELRAPGVHANIIVASPAGDGAATPGDGAQVVTPSEVIDTPRAVPVIASIEQDDGALRVQLRGAAARTRVHVIATRFVPAPVQPVPIGPSAIPLRRLDRERGARFVSGRELGDEYRYVLERRNHKRYPNLLLDKPSLLLNPWARRTTTTAVATAKGGTAHAASEQTMRTMGYAGPGAPPPPQQPGQDEAFASHDFLPAAPAVLANVVPDANGALVLALPGLGDATTVTIIVDDGAGTTVRRVHRPERELDPRDLRLRLALDPARHATQKKSITPLRAGDRLVIEDLATAKLHLIDSVERAHGYLLALRDDATLREFAFVARWHSIADGERRELYSKYACHELHLFLYCKDRAFFDAVVKPYLAHKRTKTFLDHWLLGDDCTAYLEPARLAQLNACERALLAQRLPPDDSLARVLGDQVAIIPPDPATDTRLIDALLGASGLDGDSQLANHAAAARNRAEATTEMPKMVTRMTAIAGGAAPAARPAAAEKAVLPEPEERERTRRARTTAKQPPADRRGGRAASAGEVADDGIMFDLDLRQEQQQAHYRGVDKTQEWAENNWWHRTPAESAASMIAPNRLWRDLSQHRGDTGLLSPAFGLAIGSFAEAMCALAVIDLPFVPAAHAIVAGEDSAKLTLTAAGNALAGHSQLVDGELVPGSQPLVVGTSYVRTDDRYEWDSGEQRDKYIDGPFAAGVVYTCQVVLANPTSARQRIAALVQIPRGAIGVANARTTQTLDVVLEPYGTHGHEYAFYFPSPGHWTHFGVHVARGETIVAATPGRTLEVTSGGAIDGRSWAYVSQRGSVEDVVAYLDTANIAAIDTRRVAWRMRDHAAYGAIVGVLERRREYCATLWAYALLHRDRARIAVWLRALGAQLVAAGPVLDMLDLDAEQLGTYEHLELAPLVNARAHRLGAKLRILNDGLAAQYDRFLELVAHRRAPSQEDLLAAAMYLVTQDRIDDARAMLARVRTGEPATTPPGSARSIAERMQHDYLAAYLACVDGDVGRARELANRWREHPVDRWRFKFGALAKLLDELVAPTAELGTVDPASATLRVAARPGEAGAIDPASATRPGEGGAIDPRSRAEQHGDIARTQPAFDLALDRDGIAITSQHVRGLELRFFEMDVELLFSRQPFVASDTSRFSYVEPGHREILGELPPEHRLPWPAALRGKNVVVEAVGHGMRKAKVFYANDLTTNLANQVGQVRVQRASDRSALVASYVKVYARNRGGTVTFYKDGYTDLRGWFDYASLSTSDLDNVERFAILVASDQAGAAILEASPPVR